MTVLSEFLATRLQGGVLPHMMVDNSDALLTA